MAEEERGHVVTSQGHYTATVADVSPTWGQKSLKGLFFFREFMYRDLL